MLAKKSRPHLNQSQSALTTRVQNFDITVDQSRYCHSVILHFLDAAGTKKANHHHGSLLPSNYIPSTGLHRVWRKINNYAVRIECGLCIMCWGFNLPKLYMPGHHICHEPDVQIYQVPRRDPYGSFVSLTQVLMWQYVPWCSVLKWCSEKSIAWVDDPM